MDGRAFPLKIGIDASSLIAQKTGIGSFASHLIDEFRRDPQGLDLVPLAPDSAGDLDTPARLWWEYRGLAKKAREASVDAVYSPGFSPPVTGRFRKIVTVHDLIGMLFPANARIASRFYWSTWLPRNLKKAHRLVASSECTRRDMVRLLGIPEDRIHVVPLAVKEIFRPAAPPSDERPEPFGIRRPYFLAVGSLEPRKNHLRLLAAFEKFRRDHRDYSLVIIGKPAGAEQAIERFISEKGLSEHVRLLGYVPDEALVSLYNGAAGYAMISLYEGFGLPALEAMACGLPGVIADNSSLPEVTGSAALPVDPKNEAAIEAALRVLADDATVRASLSRAALERSKKFSIQKTAREMIDIFKKECIV